MFSKKGDADNPKQEFSGSAAKGKKLPDRDATSHPKQEFGGKKSKK